MVSEYAERIKKAYLDRKNHINIDFDILNGIQFEKLCYLLLRDAGFTNLTNTPGSGDYGVDILATKNNKRYAFQCKRYSSAIGVSAIQEVSSGKMYYNADCAVVITNNIFTPNAKQLAEKIGVQLWDRHSLIYLMNNPIIGRTPEEAEYLRSLYIDLFTKRYKLSLDLSLIYTDLQATDIEYLLIGTPLEIEVLKEYLPDITYDTNMYHTIKGDRLKIYELLHDEAVAYIKSVVNTVLDYLKTISEDMRLVRYATASAGGRIALRLTGVDNISKLLSQNIEEIIYHTEGKSRIEPTKEPDTAYMIMDI